jgi:hypothetical protein
MVVTAAPGKKNKESKGKHRVGKIRKGTIAETPELLVTPTKKPRRDASRAGLTPKMEEEEINKMLSEDCKQLAKLLNQLGEYVQTSVESIKSVCVTSRGASPTSPSGTFDTVWKNYMGYCLLPARPRSLLLHYCILIALLLITHLLIYGHGLSSPLDLMKQFI